MKKKLVISLIILIIGMTLAINVVIAKNGGAGVSGFATTDNPTVGIRDSYHSTGNLQIKKAGTPLIGPSCLTMNKNVFCIQSSKGSWEGQKQYKVSNLITSQNSARAYILSEPKFSVVSNSYDANKQDNSKSQIALWKLLGQNKASQTTNSSWLAGTNFYKEAMAFQNYRTGKPNIRSISTTVTSNNGIIGPFKIEYRISGTYQNTTKNFGQISIQSVIGKKGSSSYTLSASDYELTSDAMGTNKISGVPNSNQAFYIKIKNSEVTELTSITFKEKELRAKAQYYDVEAKQGTQNLLVVYYAERFNAENTCSISINQTLTPKVKITINKKSTKTNSALQNLDLSDVEFEITAKQGTDVKNFAKKTVSGIINLEWQPINTNNIEVKIKEKNTKEDHILLKEEIVIKLKYNNSTSKWEATEEKDLENVATITNGTNISIRIMNQFISQLKIGGDPGGFNKVDQNGHKVSGAKFKVVYEQDGRKIAEDIATSNTYGKVSFPTITPTSINPIKATITEETAPAGYVRDKDFKKVINFTYDAANNTWVSEDVQGTTLLGNITYVKIEDVENKSLIEKITILKTNSQSSATKIAGAKFNIRLSNVESVKGYSTPSTGGAILLTGVTTNSSGNIVLEDIVIKDLNNNVTIEIEETEAPSGYKKINGKITVTLKREGNSYTIHTASKDSTVLDSEFLAGNVAVTNHEIALNIKNIPIIQELALEKLDSKNNEPINGAKFEVILKNVKSAKLKDDEKIDDEGNIEVIRDVVDGKFSPAIENIELKEITQPLTVTLTEKEAPVGYKKIDGTITIEVKLNASTGKYEITGYNKESNVSEREFDGEKLKISNNKVDIPLKDIPIMNIGGVVWEDTQTGNKEVDGPDDLFNNSEQGMAGIKVFLIDGVPVVNSNGQLGSTPIDQTVTTSDGKYLFEGIEVKDNYHVVFAYDGMSYQTVKKGTANNASKVDEIERDKFNEKFYIIGKDEDTGKDIAISPDGTVTQLEYTKTNGKSELVHNDGNGIKQQYVMHSKSEKVDSSNWKNTWTEAGEVNEKDSRLNINCGLTYRFFDLALGTDVKEAKVSINEKTVKYDYAQIMNGAMEDLSLDALLQGQSSTNDKPIYNLYLYASDYNYRIGDYKTDGINSFNSDASTYITNAGNELEVEVTYTVMLKNQSKFNAIVNEFVYYYNENYIPLLAAGDIVDGYKVTNIQNNKITFETADANNKLVAPDYRKEVDITFKVKKDATNGYVILGDYTNTAEITKYSNYTFDGETEKIAGIIDVDSAPDNGITNGNITHYEDDTDEAKGIKIGIDGKEPRIITGTVWDDGEKNSADGKLDTSKEKLVDDVIVQLIEVKNISGQYCEYIWQETRSGNEKDASGNDTGKREVKTTSKTTGYMGVPYEVANKRGQYQFKDFIPGNYIIRFIYGDGQTYDVTPNVQTYNGQDYQSTVNSEYKASWYNTTNYQGDSVARDNEARRLEVMAYSTKIDKDIGKALKDKTALSETWMCAETSRINVPVDADNKATESDNTGSGDSSQSIGFDNINFGLALRPQTKLTLEKHITSLKITPPGNSSSTTVDANAKIEDVMDGTINDMAGVKDGLATIVSDRDNRGFWKVETDVEELAQGANLEVVYTYVIVNDSDEDYLSSNLVNLYKNFISIDDNSDGVFENKYPEKLRTESNNVKMNMRDGNFAYNSSTGELLGQYYYTGIKGDGDTEVLSSVDGIEEALNEQFTKQTNVGDSFKVDNNIIQKTYINTAGEFVNNGKTISTVLSSKNGTDFLTIKGDNGYKVKEGSKLGNTDWSRTAKITTILSSVTNGEIGGSFPSYIAEMSSYTNAAGRRNMNGTPGDLSYVHSEDTGITMNSYVRYNDDGSIADIYTQKNTVQIVITQNMVDGTIQRDEITAQHSTLEEYQIDAVVANLNAAVRDNWDVGEILLVSIVDNTVVDLEGYEALNGLDEFWGETIIISKPTGEDKLTGLQIAIITTISVAILGAGIVLIKKLVLKK